jgi:hypothetical protein
MLKKINQKIRGVWVGVLLLTAFSACTNSSAPLPGTSPYNAANLLTPDEQTEFISAIIRYTGRLAPRATYETRFDPEFDSYYSGQISEYELELVHKGDTDGEIFFLISRSAPSLYSKRTATAGRVLFNAGNEIEEYEEIFRTWKLAPDELIKKSEFLFALMVAGEDLTPYYPEFSGDEEYIEFPNSHTYFDMEERRWTTTLFNPAEFRNSVYR